MAHEIPNELLEREIFPITDVVGDSVGRLHIQLKTDFEAADNFLLFVQLPCITPERVIRTAFKWCLDKGLITNPIYIK